MSGGSSLSRYGVDLPSRPDVGAYAYREVAHVEAFHAGAMTHRKPRPKADE